MREQSVPTLLEVEEALRQTAQRVEEWHQSLRQKHRLTDEVLLGGNEDIWTEGEQGVIRVDKWTEYFWRTQHNLRIHSNLDSRLQLNSLQIGHYNPLVARLYYPTRNFSTLRALSFSWEARYSDVLDEQLIFENGLIVRLVKDVEPGILFPTLEDENQQTLDLHFEYEEGRLVFWIGKLFSHFQSRHPIQYTKGESYLKSSQLPFGYPPTLNPISHIKTFAQLHYRETSDYDLLIGA